ncbi:MAG: alpha/beta fold hydrolase [Alphaproteobacteria bacterium]
MTPVTIGSMAARYYPASGGRAVLVCPPWGVEGLAATKSLRLLAERLAEAGHPCLVFDPRGSGHSLDQPGELIANWTEDVEAAAAALANMSGTREIVLIGMRLSAIPILMAAQKINGLVGVVLISPVASGRLHARELATTARMMAEAALFDPDETQTEYGLEVAGFPISASTLERLKTVDAKTLPAPDVPVLILHGTQSVDAAALATAWTGRPVKIIEAVALDRLSINPTRAETPHSAWSEIVLWLGQTLPTAPQTSNGGTFQIGLLQASDFSEEGLTFGRCQNLFGVLCTPSSPQSSRPIVILVNAGRNPSVGWARTGVRLARMLATEGIASLRFDLAGIGESPDRPGASDKLEDILYTEAADEDVIAAIGVAEARGYSRVGLYGACSGAFAAFRVAARDERVNGLILVNGQRFIWREGETLEQALATTYRVDGAIASRAFNLDAWAQVLRGEKSIRPILSTLISRTIGRLRRFAPTRDTRLVRADMARIAARGPIDLIYSVGDAGIDDMTRHFGASGTHLPGPACRITFVPDADHDMTPLPARQALSAAVLNAANRWSAADR